MLGGELDLVGWWLVDPRGRVSVEDLRSRLSRREPFGVGAAGGLECGVSVAVDGVGVPVVHVGGRVHADAGVPVVVVVGVHEFVQELPCVGEGDEPVGELKLIRLVILQLAPRGGLAINRWTHSTLTRRAAPIRSEAKASAKHLMSHRVLESANEAAKSATTDSHARGEQLRKSVGA